MEFKKKLQIRLYCSIGYVIIGAVLIAASYAARGENVISTIGAALAVCGIARIIKHFRITKNADALKRMEIAETDERNVSIASKARSAAFLAYIYIAFIALIAL